jgi:hypothetical protein
MATTRLSLDDVTLVSVTGVRIDEAQQAMIRSMSGISFGRSLLISTTPPTHLHKDIEWAQIPPMTSLADYSRFLLKDLLRYIDTPHVLVVQGDGFVVNADRWNPAWLEYDYIGAPWPERVRYGPHILELANRVGNGGFSLRSRRLLELVLPIDLSTLRFVTRAEDTIICHLLYDFLRGHGMRFADVDTAAAFSIESPAHSFGHTLESAFGFHGKHYFAKLMAMESAGLEAT